MERVYIVATGRSAIGSFGGSLASVPPAALGTHVARAVLERAPSGIAEVIDEVVVGNVLGAGHGMNIARQVALNSGLAVATPAYTVNHVCGSGLRAVQLAASAIALGHCRAALAGGVESMSQAGFVSLNARFGGRMGHQQLLDLMLQDGLTDAFGGCHMGITAENLAERFAISREVQDAYALESQRRAKAAQEAGYFDNEIVPVPLEKRGKVVGSFARDEYVRADTSAESLAALKPAFKSGGTVTAGNASGINDGAAFVLLCGESTLQQRGWQPIAEVVSWGTSGVAPEVMGLGPVEAVRQALGRTSMSLEQMDAIEANEAFAVQALAVGRELGWDEKVVNSWGGAIALGHPIGASGCRVLVTLLSRLSHANANLGLATLCVGGGQGIAMVVRRA